MNPYDFVPIDWNTEPERHSPSPHDRFEGISGKIEGTITTETPIFIFDSPRKSGESAQPFIKNGQNQHIIPGSSLKGLFRNLVETVRNGCLMFDELRYNYRHGGQPTNVNYRNQLPAAFRKCNTPKLCIACRMFGRIPNGTDDSNVHLGNVSFNDAVEVKICEHQEIHTIILMGAKPHHQAFYLDSTQQYIAGRKFYFHQPGEIQSPDQIGEFNPHIKPIDKRSQFAFSAQFTNLEPIELRTLLYVLNLECNMRHKLGYGKPAGLGSVRFDITKLTLIDYASRYTKDQGTEVYQNSALATELSKQTHRFATDKKSSTLNALRRIWHWDPTNTTTYAYPNQDWFNKNPTTPIGGTV